MSQTEVESNSLEDGPAPVLERSIDSQSQRLQSANEQFIFPAQAGVGYAGTSQNPVWLAVQVMMQHKAVVLGVVLVIGLAFAFRSGLDAGLEAIQYVTQLSILATALVLMLAGAFYVFITLPRTFITEWKARESFESSPPASIIVGPGEDETSDRTDAPVAEIPREGLSDFHRHSPSMEPASPSVGTVIPPAVHAIGRLPVAPPQDREEEPPQQEHAFLQQMAGIAPPPRENSKPVQNESERQQGSQAAESPCLGETRAQSPPEGAPETREQREPQHAPQWMGHVPGVATAPSPEVAAVELGVPAKVEEDPHQAAFSPPLVASIEMLDVPAAEQPSIPDSPGGAPSEDRSTAPQDQVKARPSLSKKFMAWLPFSRGEKPSGATQPEGAAALQGASGLPPTVPDSEYPKQPGTVPASVNEEGTHEKPERVVPHPPAAASTLPVWKEEAAPPAAAPLMPVPSMEVPPHRNDAHPSKAPVNEPQASPVGRGSGSVLLDIVAPRADADHAPPPKVEPTPPPPEPKHAARNGEADVPDRNAGRSQGSGLAVPSSQAEAKPAPLKVRDVSTDDIADKVWRELEKVHATFMQRADSELLALYQARKPEQARKREGELRAKEAELRSYLEAEWRRYCKVDRTADAQREL